MIAYTAIYLEAFIFVTAYNLIRPVSTSTWSAYWHFNIYLSIILGTIVLVWFTIGDVIDLRRLFKGFAEETVDTKDDGFVESSKK